MTQTWTPAGYQQHAAFVPALGEGILERLAPVAGERILDLGCGDGTLTARLVERGAQVVGVDASPAMIEGARSRGLDARVMDATALTFDREFDAVFSNAVLHWIRDQDAMLRGVARALKPGGRFAAEFGGHTNVAAISVAIRAVLSRHSVPLTWPWYYPSADEYAARLDANGFAVDMITLFPRPTPLPTGILGWLRTFRAGMFDGVPAEEQQKMEEEIAELLAPALRDSDGRWTADYVRLQFVARLRG